MKKAQKLLLELEKQQKIDDSLGFPTVFKDVSDRKENSFDKRQYKTLKPVSLILRVFCKKLVKVSIGLMKFLRKPLSKKVSKSLGYKAIIKQVYFKNRGYDISIRIFIPIFECKNKLKVIYFIHGGCFFAGSSYAYDEILKYLANNTPCLVFAIDYRLVPEFNYTESYSDVYQGLKYVYENAEKFGGDKNQIWVTGDSAGGNFAIYCSKRDLEERTNIVKGQVLYYPTVNMVGFKDKYFEKRNYEYFELNKKGHKLVKPFLHVIDDITKPMEKVLNTNNLNNSQLSPYIIQDFSNFPNTLLIFGDYDFLTNENIAFAHKLYDSKVNLKTIIYKGMTHGFLNFLGKFYQAEDSVKETINFINKFSLDYIANSKKYVKI